VCLADETGHNRQYVERELRGLVGLRLQPQFFPGDVVKLIDAGTYDLGFGDGPQFVMVLVRSFEKRFFFLLLVV
jgi:hypothetical protein